MGGIGGFLSDLGQAEFQRIGQRSPIGKALYNRYKPNAPGTGIPEGPPPINPDGSPDTSGQDAMQGANQAAGLGDLSKPNAGMSASMDNTMPDAASMATMSPWNQPSQSNGRGALGGLASMAMMGAAKGTIVTKPTIARIGESGPEAVVPLTPRPGNHLNPDILEGHVSEPKVPGVRYSRYKTYNRLGPGQGGEI